MSAAQTNINDSDFITRFEDLTLAPECFNHLGHVRLAWLYLTRFGLDTALSKVSGGIKAYATSHGATGKYHATVTDAVVRIMARRIELQDSSSWEVFVQKNQDVVSDMVTLLCRHYSHDYLFSDTCRLQVMPPNVREI